MKLGTFKGRAVKDTLQYGETKNAYPQIAVTMRMAIDGGTQDAVTFLIFSPDAAPYSFERLRALGWKGQDLSQDLVGIDANEVDVNVRADEYNGKTQYKCDIVAGGGTVKLDKPISREAFAAKVKAISGVQGSIGGAGAGGGSRPPF
jgi:hypothetical protein